MVKRNHPSNIKARCNSGILKLLRVLTVLLKIMGGFPYSVMKEEVKGSKKDRTMECTAGLRLGPYKMKPLALVWSAVMMFLTVGGAVLMYIERPDTSAFFGASKLLGLLQILTMKAEAAVAFLTLLMLVCFSPRLVRLINLLQQVCGDVVCPWKPHKDVTFLMLLSVVVLCQCCSSVAMILAYPHFREIFDVNPHSTVTSWVWLSCKIIIRNIVVILLYSMGHILASLYPFCSPTFPAAVRKGATRLSGHFVQENRITGVQRESGCKKDNKKDVNCVTDENVDGRDKPGRSGDEGKWEASAEEEARASCERLFRLNECQQALNDYFAWPVTVLAAHATFNVSELIFFLSTGQASVPYLRIVCGFTMLDSLANLGFIFFSPGDILDQMDKLSCSVIMRQAHTNDLRLKLQLNHLLDMAQRYPDFNMGRVFILRRERLVEILRFVVMYVVIFHQFWTTEE